jgi:putative tryptophan/tyrosine transport system substrate-binding protein
MIWIRTFLISTTLLFGVFLPLAGHTDSGNKIAILLSSSDAPFEEALAGFQGHLAKQNIKTEYEVYQLDHDASKAEQTIQKIRKSGARMLVTLGSFATEAAAKQSVGIPIVACLVLRTDDLATIPHATGVGLEFPLDVQFSWLKTMLPKTETVGVLYNPRENKKRVEAAGRAARRLGLRLEAVEVENPQDIPSALATLAKRADVLWGLTDRLTLSPQMAKHILLFAFRNKIPFIGPSETWVKAGALYSLDWDYRDMGAQCGTMAQQILQGARPEELPPTTPRKILYSINLKTAEQMKLSIPEDVARKARKTY